VFLAVWGSKWSGWHGIAGRLSRSTYNIPWLFVLSDDLMLGQPPAPKQVLANLGSCHLTSCYGQSLAILS